MDVLIETQQPLNFFFVFQGGLSTSSEMCLAFILYYPKIPLQACQTAPTVSSLINYFGLSYVKYVMLHNE